MVLDTRLRTEVEPESTSDRDNAIQLLATKMWPSHNTYAPNTERLDFLIRLHVQIFKLHLRQLATTIINYIPLLRQTTLLFKPKPSTFLSQSTTLFSYFLFTYFIHSLRSILIQHAQQSIRISAHSKKANLMSLLQLPSSRNSSPIIVMPGISYRNLSIDINMFCNEENIEEPVS